MRFRDYYQTLGVDRGTSQEEIQKGFRRLARKYHPDTSKEPQATDRFKEINEAYEVLKDPEKRKRYDTLGADWKAGQEFTPPPGWEGFSFNTGDPASGGSFEFRDSGSGLGGFGFSDFFQSMFGGGIRGFGGGGGTRTQVRRGGDIETQISVSLEEAHLGTKKAFQLRREDSSTRRYDVRVPANTRDGDRLRLSGQGQESLGGGAAGDLLIRVRVTPHPRLQADGDNLRTEVALAPWEAALGAKVPVPTLDGSVTLTVPAGTRSGRTLRLRGQGMSRMGGGRGDLLATVRIEVPATLTDRERELFEELARESKFRPRGE